MTTIITDFESYIPEAEVFRKSQAYDSLHLELTVVLQTPFMLDYQKDLLQELRWNVQDIFWQDQQNSSQIQKQLEHTLHNFNTQLAIFAEKSKYSEMISLRWVVQIWSADYYIASLIGLTSLMIYRKNKLIHHVINQLSPQQKVSLFSELVDGKVMHGDIIAIVGWDISIVMDENDLNHVWSALSEEYTFDTIVQEHIASRVDPQDFVFCQQHTLALNSRRSRLTNYQEMTQRNTSISSLSRRILSHKSAVAIGALILLLGYLLWFMISLFVKQNPNLQVADTSSLPTIWEIRQDLSQFANIDPSSDSKSLLYDQIVKKIEILEKANKRPNDINELKKLVNQQFYQEFNITSLTDNELNDSYIYTFDAWDITLGNPIKLLYHKSLAVVWSQGVRFGMIDNTYRGNMITTITPLIGCSLNILKNGYYCFDQLSNVTMISKWSQETVTTKGGIFPSLIQDIATYGNTNMYILTKDPTLNAKGIYIVKYNNIIRSTKDFTEAKYYSFTESGATTFASGFHQFAIDSTFLMRSPDQKKLYQFWRDKNSELVNSRTIKMIGWNQEYKPFSTDVKVLANSTSPYVYLFDKINKTLTIYNSSPSKTNETNTSTFQLQYVFRFDFVSADPIIDLVVSQDEKPVLYMLNKKWITMIKLHEFLDQYKNMDASQTTPSSWTLLQ
jgi:hypothetical protein